MIYILGNGGLAREIMGYIESTKSIYSIYFHDYTDFDFPPHEYYYARNRCIVGSGNPQANKKIALAALDEKYVPISYDLSVFNGSGFTADGTIICPGACITDNVKIGDFVVISLNTTVGHDTQIGNYCVINPGANISGHCKIGECTLIGANAFIREGITIGKNCIIGAGSVVTKNIYDGEIWYGNPATKKGVVSE